MAIVCEGGIRFSDDFLGFPHSRTKFLYVCGPAINYLKKRGIKYLGPETVNINGSVKKHLADKSDPEESILVHGEIGPTWSPALMAVGVMMTDAREGSSLMDLPKIAGLLHHTNFYRDPINMAIVEDGYNPDKITATEMHVDGRRELGNFTDSVAKLVAAGKRTHGVIDLYHLLHCLDFKFTELPEQICRLRKKVLDLGASISYHVAVGDPTLDGIDISSWLITQKKLVQECSSAMYDGVGSQWGFTTFEDQWRDRHPSKAILDILSERKLALTQVMTDPGTNLLCPVVQY